MIRRAARLLALLLSLVLGAGCASTKVEGAFDSALFPRANSASADSPMPGRVALLALPQVKDRVYEITHQPAAGLRLPVGRIVEEAVRATLTDALQGGVQQVDEVPAAGSGFAATLVIESVQAEDDNRLLWILPLPVYPYLIGNSAFYARLAFDARLLDAGGRSIWTHTYDSGQEIYKRPPFSSMDTMHAGLVRMAHESAWRLSQQLAGDLREALAAERMRPREL